MAEWHYIQDGQQRGPVSLEELQARVREGTLRAQDLVWNPALPQWTAAAAIPELAVPAGAEPVPAQVISYAAPQMEALLVTERCYDLLRRTTPWMRFMAILGFIGGGLIALGAVFVILSVVITARDLSFLGLMVFFYALVGGAVLTPAFHLNRLASRSIVLLRVKRSDSLEAMFEAHRSFWRLVGILSVAVIVGYFVLIGAVVFMGVLF